MFKGIKNATRIFSKKKGFDFQNYDTHETGNIWITDHTNLGFLGSKTGSSSTETSQKPETKKVEKPKEEVKKVEVKKETEKNEVILQPTKETKTEEKNSNKVAEEKEVSTTPQKPFESPSEISSPKNIAELKAKQNAESQAKDKEEVSQKDWESLHESFKKQLRKSFAEQLGEHPNKESVIARGKE